MFFLLVTHEEFFLLVTLLVCYFGVISPIVVRYVLLFNIFRLVCFLPSFR